MTSRARTATDDDIRASSLPAVYRPRYVTSTSPAVVDELPNPLEFAVGRSLERRFDPTRRASDDSEEEDEEAEFDESLSPIDEEDLEGRERDEPD